MEKENTKIPHQNLDNRPVHLTYRLAGSLPVSVLEDIRLKHEERKRQVEETVEQLPAAQQPGETWYDQRQRPRSRSRWICWRWCRACR